MPAREFDTLIAAWGAVVMQCRRVLATVDNSTNIEESLPVNLAICELQRVVNIALPYYAPSPPIPLPGRVEVLEDVIRRLRDEIDTFCDEGKRLRDECERALSDR